jgi:hypothetical protein
MRVVDSVISQNASYENRLDKFVRWKLCCHLGLSRTGRSTPQRLWLMSIPRAAISARYSSQVCFGLARFCSPDPFSFWVAERAPEGIEPSGEKFGVRFSEEATTEEWPSEPDDDGGATKISVDISGVTSGVRGR